MARIRSVHPGLWTDEDFVSINPLARLLFIGLWGECDDAGIFAWKPLTLKMRLLPADTCDISALLDIIEAAGMVRRFRADNHDYGAVRNFGRFQRPEKPKYAHPMTPEIAKYVCFQSKSHTGSDKKASPFGGKSGDEIQPLHSEDTTGNGAGTPPASPTNPRQVCDAENTYSIESTTSPEIVGYQSATDPRQVADQTPTRPQPVGNLSAKVGAEGIGIGKGEEKEERKEKETTNVVSQKKPEVAKSNGTRLPADWQPSPEDRAFASNLSLDTDKIAEDFRDYWRAKAGEGGRKVDWSATWRRWCRKANDDRHGGNGRGNGGGNRAPKAGPLDWVYDKYHPNGDRQTQNGESLFPTIDGFAERFN